MNSSVHLSPKGNDSNRGSPDRPVATLARALEVAREAPAGVRNPQLRASASELATGTALVDFGKLERSAISSSLQLHSPIRDQSVKHEIHCLTGRADPRTSARCYRDWLPV